MATVYISMGLAGSNSATPGIPIYDRDARTETITSSGTTAAGSLAARTGDVATVFCATAVYAKLGAAPTAAPTTGRYIPGGIPVDIKTRKDDVIAVIDV